MRKNLHIICGNCGNTEGLSFSVSGVSLVHVVCPRCNSTCDLGDEISNLSSRTEQVDFNIQQEGKRPYPLTWSVVLKDSGRTKLQLVKAIKDLGVSLREAKNITDFQLIGGNGLVLSGLDRDAAEQAAAVLIEAGASVVLIESETGKQILPKYGKES